MMSPSRSAMATRMLIEALPLFVSATIQFSFYRRRVAVRHISPFILVSALARVLSR